MKVIALTGGIGMGKSTAAAAFRRAGLPVFDADATVHALQAPGGRAVAPIARAFPDTVRDGAVAGTAQAGIDRAALRRRVIGDEAAMRRLEAIVHPLVRAAERAFLGRCRRAGRPLAVLDIPLLFETGGASRRTLRRGLIVTVSAPRAVQMARVRRRRRLTDAQIRALIARQLPDAERRRRADVVIRTGLSRGHAARAIHRLLHRLRGPAVQ